MPVIRPSYVPEDEERLYRRPRRRRRRWLPALLVWMVLAPAMLWLGGFLQFANSLATESQEPIQAADAIVVLTGGKDRLEAGLGLLTRGQGKRMLISGVHETTSRQDLQALLAGTEADRAADTESGSILDCCVDLGHAALNTIGNAQETARWAARHGYRVLIVVTANYHMPRSMLEMRAALPDAILIPYPVRSANVPIGKWWRYPGTARLVAGEYTKYLISLIRLRVTGRAI